MNKNAIVKDSPQWFHPGCLDNSALRTIPSAVPFFSWLLPRWFSFLQSTWSLKPMLRYSGHMFRFFFFLLLMKIFLRVLLLILCWCAEMSCLFQLSGLFFLPVLIQPSTQAFLVSCSLFVFPLGTLCRLMFSLLLHACNIKDLILCIILFSVRLCFLPFRLCLFLSSQSTPLEWEESILYFFCCRC